MEFVKKIMLFQSLVVFFFWRWLFLYLKNKFQEEFLLEFHFSKILSRPKGKVQNEWEPGRLWFFGIWCGWGSFPSWARPFWRPFWRISFSRLRGVIFQNPDTKRYGHQQNLGIISWVFFPTETPQVTNTTCGDNEGNHKEIRKPTHLFSHSERASSASAPASAEPMVNKMASYVYTRYKWPENIPRLTGVISPRVRRGVTNGFWDQISRTHIKSSHFLVGFSIRDDEPQHSSQGNAGFHMIFTRLWMTGHTTPKGYPLPVSQLKALKCWEENSSFLHCDQPFVLTKT